MKSFTLKLHGRGYLVKDFIEYWSMCRDTYERMTNDPGKHDKLNKMIAAMPEKEVMSEN